MTRTPLMPKATAVWLVDNTSLTFDQIAEFCGLHVLEVKGIADGDVAHGIKGMDPIASGQLTRQEIRDAQEDAKYHLKLSEPKVEIPEVKTKRGPRYTPVSRRQDRPNAILWLLRSHAELKDSQVMRLVGTTKPTIQSIRERTHWNSPNLQPADPVTLGLCSQTDLDSAVQSAAQRLERERKKAEKAAGKSGTLLPAEETIAEKSEADATMSPETGEPSVVGQDERDAPLAAEAPTAEPVAADVFGTSPPAPKPEEEKIPDVDSVFAKLKVLKDGSQEEESKEES